MDHGGAEGGGEEKAQKLGELYKQREYKHFIIAACLRRTTCCYMGSGESQSSRREYNGAVSVFEIGRETLFFILTSPNHHPFHIKMEIVSIIFPPFNLMRLLTVHEISRDKSLD